MPKWRKLTMSDRLRELRRNRGLTQKELAECIGCSNGAYSKYETGDREPSIIILKRLANFYDVSVDYLIGRDIEELNTLTKSERELLDIFRRAPEYVRNCAIQLLNVLINSYRDQ